MVDDKQMRSEILNNIRKLAVKLSSKDQAAFQDFIGFFYEHVSLTDLKEKSILDLYGSALSVFLFLKEQHKKPISMRIYNPDFEQHGWVSTHTIIEIVGLESPFVVDSIRSELLRQGHQVYLTLHAAELTLTRDNTAHIKTITRNHAEQHGGHQGDYFCMLVEIARCNPSEFPVIEQGIEEVFHQISQAVNDWEPMMATLKSCLDAIKNTSFYEQSSQVREAAYFIDWISDHITLLGYEITRVAHTASGVQRVLDSTSSLGVCAKQTQEIAYRYDDLSEACQNMLAAAEPVLFLGKAKQISKVHRSTHYDFVLIKELNSKNEVVAEHKFFGLFGSAAYTTRPTSIPMVRSKVKNIIARANVSISSHGGKKLLHILETLPRDDLFQATEDELYHWSLGIYFLQERQRVKLFVRADPFNKFFSCLVFVPRDKFDSILRQKMQHVLQDALGAEEISFSTRFSESVLARIHYVAMLPSSAQMEELDWDALESKLSDVAMTWQEELTEALHEHFGEQKAAALHKKYVASLAFSPSYKDDFIARTAVYDIQNLEKLSEQQILSLSFYKPANFRADLLHFKLFQYGKPAPLSDIVPILENFGLLVESERPYQIAPENTPFLWINDFTLRRSTCDLDVDEIRDLFQEAFCRVWHHEAENDGFNRLILSSGLNWREVMILRCYAKYLWQIGFTFTQNYLEEALFEHPNITRKLIEMFSVRLDPAFQGDRQEAQERLSAEIDKRLEAVSSLDQDRILSRFRSVIEATLRTNFYQLDRSGEVKTYVSLKLNPKAIPELPAPVPEFEIWVYSPRVEGVHLRTSSVARGGLRWSDRREDFRTEVLGLMKAQRVKNSVIVPMGAKGGFYPKMLPVGGTRDQILEEGIACYKTFICGLLDITDNLVEDAIVPPSRVVSHDQPDTYLVVAADKGTASFSDIANSISHQYNFWMGDAFASGGSQGYDHKKMAITARGAFESVRKHFQRLGRNIEEEPFTAIGIGDMSGDVFGNGLLLSKQYKLLAAFNHMHVFCDPNPDPALSFAERERLFALPRSQWSDYNPELISEGGGVFLRSAKSIPISPAMKEVFGIPKNILTPAEFIKYLLKAEVDLLWNGGIGTYVKSKKETHAAVGDRTNDGVRINGEELRAKVVGEGGNLGFTQLGRIEYNASGGLINTDAIDNSAGVDCSDHEVNIKIALNEMIVSGDMTEKQRTQLLVAMTDEVAELVLINNRAQNDAISLSMYHAATNLDMHRRLIQELAEHAGLDRELEFIPDDVMLDERKQKEEGLTRPEIAVLMSYTKIWLKEHLLASPLVEQEDVQSFLYAEFPTRMHGLCQQAIEHHRLKKEIVATLLSNKVVNEMGISFVHRLHDETGARPARITRAYVLARLIFDVPALLGSLQELQKSLDAEVVSRLHYEITRLLRRATRWLVRNTQGDEPITTLAESFKPLVDEMYQQLPQALMAAAKTHYDQTLESFSIDGVPLEMAQRVASFSAMNSALDIADAALSHQLPVPQITALYFAVGSHLHFGWLREQIKMHPVSSHWDALARASFRDTLDGEQRDLSVDILTRSVIEQPITCENASSITETWAKNNAPRLFRWEQMIQEVRHAPQRNFVMYSVLMRELMELAPSDDRKTRLESEA